MLVRTSRLVALVLLASLTVAGWGSGVARAATITFDSTSGIVPTPYVEKGYQFSSTYAVFLGGGLLFDPVPGQTTTLTQVGGGAFSLATIDFGDMFDIFSNPVTFDIAFTFTGGGPTLHATQSTNASIGLQTFTYNFSNLLSVSWTATSAPLVAGLRWDNVVVSDAPVAATPIPAALPLFAAALGGLGWMGWRRKKLAAL